MRFKGALFASALVGAAALTVLPAGGDSADSTTSIPQLTGFHQILVDDAAGYVFLSATPRTRVQTPEPTTLR